MDFIVVPHATSGSKLDEMVIPVNRIRYISIDRHSPVQTAIIELEASNDDSTHLIRIDSSRMSVDQLLDMLRMISGNEGNTH